MKNQRDPCDDFPFPQEKQQSQKNDPSEEQSS